MALIRRYVVIFTTSRCPFADVVAAHLIGEMQSTQPLPSWLEDILIFGIEKFDGPGLFHKRPLKGSKPFLYIGNPSALLTLYTDRGLFIDAVRVVETVLNVEGRKGKSAHRLPEKGDIDSVPYNKIDRLHGLMLVFEKKREVPEEAKQSLKNARGSLRTCLEQHFELLKISEDGLRSARMLAR